MKRLDLHGNTIHNGWKKFCLHVDQCYFDGIRNIVVVTGQGEMKKEIQIWGQQHRYVQHIQQIPTNAGAWNITVAKNKKVSNHLNNNNHNMITMIEKLRKKYQ